MMNFLGDEPPCVIELDDIRERTKLNGPWSDQEIESLAEEMFRSYRFYLSDGIPIDLVRAAELFGYQAKPYVSLGQNREFEVAGTIELHRRIIKYATSFELTSQRFTIAHELGHAALHLLEGQHRDRPLDGVQNRALLPKNEREANRFASAFTMPRELVISDFIRTFIVVPFVLTEEKTAFAMCGANLRDARHRFRTRRSVSMYLAKTGSFNSGPIKPFHARYEVAPTVAAIRFEELGLVAHVG